VEEQRRRLLGEICETVHEVADEIGVGEVESAQIAAPQMADPLGAVMSLESTELERV
jgi:hypothetical protein